MHRVETTDGQYPAKASVRLVLRDILNVGTGALAAVAIFNASFAALLPVSVLALVLGTLHMRRLTGTDIAFSALAGMACLSLLWTETPNFSKGAALTQLGCLGIFLLIRGTVTHPRAFLLACIGYLAGCFLAVREVHDRLGGFAFRASIAGDRAALDGFNATYLAYAMAMGLVVCLFLVQLRLSLIGRALVLASVASLLAGIALTGTRAALVSVAAVLAWLVVGRVTRGRAPLRILIWSVIGVGIGIATGLINSVVARFVVQSERENGSLNNRIPTWERAVEVFLEHPILGAGVGSFRGLNDLGIVAHNGFLEIASGLGVAGLCLLLYTLFGVLLYETRDLPHRGLLVGAVVAVTAPCFLSGNWVQSPAMWAVLALLTRFSVASPHPETAQTLHASSRALAPTP